MAAELQVAHDIQIDLMPKSMKLIGTDTITVKSAGDKRLNFRLSKHVSILNLDINGKPGNYEFREPGVVFGIESDKRIATDSQWRFSARRERLETRSVPIRPSAVQSSVSVEPVQGRHSQRVS